MRDSVPLPGDRVAERYLLGPEIGGGATSVVFEATDLVSGRPVALKVMRSGALHPSVRERVAREAAFSARIEHPGVVRTLASGEVGDLPYVVMERLEGEDLASLLRRRGQLPLREALLLGIELGSALDAAHAAGVVHRDIKPANVFVEQLEGEHVRLKILDFGLARTEGAEADLTLAGEILGSLPYVAPELLDGDGQATAASDRYGLLCVVYELIFGCPPFSEPSRAALCHAIRHDEPSLPLRFEPPLQARLGAFFARGLHKHPHERFDDGPELGAALRALRDALDGGTTEVAPRPTIPDRFRIERLIAEGAHGEVFAVVERASGRELALKRLRSVSPEAVSRLKREFRALRDVTSPHVARIEELHVDGELAFFTMELVRGTRLSEAPTLAQAEGRRVLAGIAAGLVALHDRGLVHRDLKPSNVVLDPNGRAVIVDLGLVLADGEHAPLGGTPGFVAPEALDGVVGAALDCYALGVVGLEVTLGRARARELLRRAEPSVDAALADTSDDVREVATLCFELLSPDPTRRPSARQAFERLAPHAAPESARFQARRADLPFVGRQSELAELDAAFHQALREPVVVVVEGAPGVGKTALVEAFAARASDSEGALVLSSRCHPAESVPLPALDAGIERLADELKGRDARLVPSVAPRRIRALCRLLPPLAQIPWPAWAAAEELLSTDPSEQRSSAIDALRELLGRLSAQRRVLLFVDDAQWLDADSAGILRAIYGSADAPNLLLVLTRRVESDPTEAWDPLPGVAVPRRSLWLGPLPAADGAVLARMLHQQRTGGEARELGALVEAGAGNPYFLWLLAGRDRVEGALTPAGVLLELYRGLGGSARRLLEALALCQRPMALRTLLHATGIDDPSVAVELEQSKLVRTSRWRREPHIEPYHRLVAEAVAGALEPDLTRALHGALARAIRALEPADELSLVGHLAASGAIGEAARIAERASANATDRLAFDTAALLLETALRHAVLGSRERGALLEKLALALTNAGRTHDAAEILLAASEHVEGGSGSLRRRAGELFLQSGDLTRGFAVLERALTEHGLALSEHPLAALAEGLDKLAALVARGLGYTPRSEQECAVEELDRIDLCLSLGQGLTYVDLRFLGFLLEGVRLALEVGEPKRLQRALALFVAGTASHLPHPLVQSALELCRGLSQAVGDAYAGVLTLVAEAEVAHFEGEFLTAELCCEKAERILLESCTGAARELADVRIRSVLLQYSQKGDYKSIFGRSRGWLFDAEARQDRFYANWLRAAHALAWVARDQPDKARAELERAEADWPGGSGVFEVAVVLYLDVVDRYLGNAKQEPAQARPSVLDSPASQTPFLAGYLWLHRGWYALRSLAERGTERARAAEAILRLRGLGLKSWQASADALEANLAFLEGRREAAIALLEGAERALRELSVLSLAACARKRRGQLTAGALGARLVAEADAQLVELGVVAPDRFAGAYFAPFHLRAGAADAITLVGDRLRG